MNTRWYTRQFLLFVLVIFFGACGGDGCGCGGFENVPYPEDKYALTIPTSGTVRVTDAGLQFVENNLPTIVAGLLPNGLDFCIPRQTGTPQVCHLGETCNDGSEGCQMTMTIDDASITPAPPDTLDVQVNIGGLDETLSVNLIGANCTIKLHKPGDQNLPASFGVKAPVTFAVDSASPMNDVRIELGDLELDTSQLAFEIDPVNFLDFLLCETIDLAAGLDFVRGLLLDQIQGQFEPIIRDTLDQQLCQSCDNGCIAGTSCDMDLNICRYADDTCPQNPLGLEGRMLVGELLSDFTEETEAAVDLTVRAADHAVVDTGLTLGLRSGYHPTEESICAPVDPTVRDYVATPISPTVSGNAHPAGGAFHFGVAYHEKAIEHLLWSVWGSGATCLNVGSQNFGLISTGAFAPVLPSIRDLTLGKTSAAMLKIVPQRPPVVQLGANRITANGNSYTIDEPLMTIDWKQLDVHIYGYAQDRYTRLLTIRMDLLLPVGVAADGMGGLIPVLGDFEGAIQNAQVINAEMISEDPTRILDLLPTLIGFALPSLAGSLSNAIQLPEVFGFRIDIGPGDITSVDNNTQVAIFADLQIVPPAPFTLGAETSIVGTRVDYSRRTPSGLVRPRAYVDLMSLDDLSLTSMGEVEYSYRVDRGTWSLYEKTNQLVIDNPVLVLSGRHLVEVRARYVDAPNTVDRTPAAAEIIVDWEAPTLDAEKLGDTIQLTGSDLVDDPRDLEFRYRTVTAEGGSSWSGWSNLSSIDLSALDLPARFRLEAQVRDTTGNIGSVDGTFTMQQPLERTEAPAGPAVSEPQAGCSSAGSGSPANLVWLLLGALAFAASRRRRGLRLEVLGLAAVMSISACKCKDDTEGTDGVCDPACAEGQLCIDGTCATPPECTTDADCGANSECQNGMCVDVPVCPEICRCEDNEFAECDADGMCLCTPYCEAGCGDGQFCCHESNSCQALTDPCVDTMCEVGFGPVAQTDSTADESTCDVKLGECSCQELPPLPWGWIGHYASIDRNAGVTAIAAYNSTYDDLMVGIVGAGNSVSWQFVDGVPSDGMVTGSLNGPRGGISTEGEDVGRYTSLAIDASGAIHVLYRDEDRNVLKYAVGTGSGENYTFQLSDFDTEGDTGYWTSMVLDGNRLHAVYTAKSVAVGGGFESQLRYVAWDVGGSPADPTAVSETIVSGAAQNPCGGDCPGRRDVCFASTGTCAEPSSDCPDACADDSECRAGACELVYTEGPADYLVSPGSLAELSKTSDGLLVVFWDGTQNAVGWSIRDFSGWSTPAYAGLETGPYGSGQVDANGDLHVAYMDHSLPGLVYHNVTQGIVEPVTDGIRDTAAGWLVTDIGEDVSLRIPDSGGVSLLFQDATLHVLKRATRDAAGNWSVEDIAAPGTPYTGAHGFYTAMLKSGAAQFAVELVIDAQQDPTLVQPAFHE